MQSSILQIKTAFEVEGMSPEDIALDQDLSLEAVKAALMQSSSKYRKDCRKEPEEEDRLNFSNDQLVSVNQRIFDLAMSAETPDGFPDTRVQADLCKYIRDDKKGRKELVRAIQNNNTFNLLQFNEKIQQARLIADKAKAKLIEV